MQRVHPLFRDKKIDAETAIPLLSAFQKSKDEVGKISSTTTIVDEDGISKRVGLNKKGDIVKEIGQAPSNSFFGSPEDQAKADVYKQQNTRPLISLMQLRMKH